MVPYYEGNDLVGWCVTTNKLNCHIYIIIIKYSNDDKILPKVDDEKGEYLLDTNVNIHDYGSDRIIFLKHF